MTPRLDVTSGFPSVADELSIKLSSLFYACNDKKQDEIVVLFFLIGVTLEVERRLET